MTDISGLIRMRNRFLALTATSFLVWQCMHLLEGALPTSTGAFAAIGLAGFVGLAGFMGAMIMFLIYAGRVTKTQTQAVIQDELFAFNQAKALRIGFIALMGFVIAGFVASDFVELPTELTFRVLMMVGVAVPIFAFLAFDRGSGDEGDTRYDSGADL